MMNDRKVGEVGMTREYVVKVTDTVVPDAFQKFETEWSPEQEIVRCKDCMHRPADPENKKFGQYLIFPDEICPCQADDPWYSWMPNDDWFCADGERSDKT